jgi:ABC-type bacteriocin/lantibiotic exporter with double-glycine peptidase domain
MLKLFLLILIILLPPVTFVFFYIKKKLTATKKSIQSSNEKSFQYLLDALKGYVEGNIYQRIIFSMDDLVKQGKYSANIYLNQLSVQTMPNRIIETFAVLGLFVLIVIAKWSDINDSSTIITIGAFMAAAYKIIPGIVKIINAMGQMRAYDFSINELETFAEKAKSEDQINRPEPINAIQIRDLDFQYTDNLVLKDFSLSIKKGDFIGITGRSGKGKTTIFNLLLGFLSPTNGEILINDSFVSNKEIKKYWPQISYVRQQSFFIHDTILRNITLEEESFDKERLESALKISGLCDFIKQSPDGLDKMITENGKNISGGQQQRIAIARALYKNAELILLDELF